MRVPRLTAEFAIGTPFGSYALGPGSSRPAADHGVRLMQGAAPGPVVLPAPPPVIAPLPVDPCAGMGQTYGTCYGADNSTYDRIDCAACCRGERGVRWV